MSWYTRSRSANWVCILFWFMSGGKPARLPGIRFHGVACRTPRAPLGETRVFGPAPHSPRQPHCSALTPSPARSLNISYTVTEPVFLQAVLVQTCTQPPLFAKPLHPCRACSRTRQPHTRRSHIGAVEARRGPQNCNNNGPTGHTR